MQNMPWAHDKLSLHFKPTSINPLLSPAKSTTSLQPHVSHTLEDAQHVATHSKHLLSHDNTNGSGHF